MTIGILLFLILVGVIASFVRQQYLIITAPKPDPAYHTKEQNFINELSVHAQEIQAKHNILTSVTLAQAILESNWGESELASSANNLFGVKSTTSKPHVSMKTKEFEKGKWKEITANFRKYRDWEESLDDHAALFLNGTSWHRDKYRSVITAKNYKQAAHALREAGYATDPGYTDKLIELVEKYHLEKYDRISDKIYYNAKADRQAKVKAGVDETIWSRPYGLKGAQPLESTKYYQRDKLQITREVKTDSGVWVQLHQKDKNIGWIQSKYLEKK